MLILLLYVHPPPQLCPHSLVTSKNDYNKCRHDWTVGHP
jgi:hypothetical protein